MGRLVRWAARDVLLADAEVEPMGNPWVLGNT